MLLGMNCKAKFISSIILIVGILCQYVAWAEGDLLRARAYGEKISDAAMSNPQNEVPQDSTSQTVAKSAERKILLANQRGLHARVALFLCSMGELIWPTLGLKIYISNPDRTISYEVTLDNMLNLQQMGIYKACDVLVRVEVMQGVAKIAFLEGVLDVLEEAFRDTSDLGVLFTRYKNNYYINLLLKKRNNIYADSTNDNDLDAVSVTLASI
jgi:phosphotransferase system HPr-like phosphotransfer protein